MQSPINKRDDNAFLSKKSPNETLKELMLLLRSFPI